MSLFNRVKEGDEFIATSDGIGGSNLKPKGGGSNNSGR
jgi:hypothetical protein